jgi:hypothetical protein
LVEGFVRNQIQQGGYVCFSKAVLQVIGSISALIGLAKLD